MLTSENGDFLTPKKWQDRYESPADRQFSYIMIQCIPWAWEARWPNGRQAGLRIRRSRFEPWSESLCCILGKGTFHKQCLSLSRCIIIIKLVPVIPVLGVTLWWTDIPSSGKRQCYRDQNKFDPLDDCCLQ